MYVNTIDCYVYSFCLVPCSQQVHNSYSQTVGHLQIIAESFEDKFEIFEDQ